MSRRIRNSKTHRVWHRYFGHPRVVRAVTAVTIHLVVVGKVANQ